MIDRADLLGEALFEEREALNRALVKGADGCGAGFYQAGEVLHRKRPRPIDGQVEWAGVLDGVRSHLAIAHVRTATTGQGAEDTQPFRMRQWLFAHVGEVTGFDMVRERLAQSLPDFLQRNIRGHSDSELLFHVVLSFLHDAGQLESVDVSNAAVVSALRSSVMLVDRHAKEVGAKPGSLTLALTNGRQLFALRRGQALAVVKQERVPHRDSDAPGNGTPTGSMRYVIVASVPNDDTPPGYRALDDGEVVCVDRDLEVSTYRL
jgi:glutamine amidotransferase